MRGPSFLEGVLVALVAALGASVAQVLLTLALPRPAALGLIAAGLGLAYLLYLLGRSRERAGRIVAVIAWVPITGTALALAPDPWTQVLVQAGLIWLVRSLWHQASPLAALLDLGLILAGLAAALWAALHSGSLFLAVWCLFLVQALFSTIPERVAGRQRGIEAPDPFDLAARAAGSALARIDRRGAP